MHQREEFRVCIKQIFCPNDRTIFRIKAFFRAPNQKVRREMPNRSYLFCSIPNTSACRRRNSSIHPRIFINLCLIKNAHLPKNFLIALAALFHFRPRADPLALQSRLSAFGLTMPRKSRIDLGIPRVFIAPCGILCSRVAPVLSLVLEGDTSLPHPHPQVPPEFLYASEGVG